MQPEIIVGLFGGQSKQMMQLRASSDNAEFDVDCSLLSIDDCTHVCTFEANDTLGFEVEVVDVG